jgi:hypothetical protein
MTAVDSSPKGVCFVTNGIIKHSGGNAAAVVNGNSTAICTSGAATATNTLGVGIAPVSGANFTVALYQAGTGTADITSPTSGTLIGQVAVTVATSSVSGVVSPAKSGIFYRADSTASTSSGVIADDTISNMTASAAYKSGASSLPWTLTNYATIRVADAYGVALTSTTGLLTATATNGAWVGLGGGGGSAASTSSHQSTAFLTGTSGQPDGAALAVSAPSAAPLTTTVTIAYNGVTLGTKTFVFTGPITKVTIAAPSHINVLSHTVGTVAQANKLFKGAAISFADSAGNAIYPLASGTTPYLTGYLATAASSDRTTVLSVIPTSSVTGYIDWTCGTSATTDNAIVTFTNTDGTIATSNAQKVSCADVASSYVATFDKSTYSPGDLATLTVTFKDAKGNLAADYKGDVSVDAGTSTYYFANYVSGTTPIVSISGGTLASAPATTSLTSNGVATFTVLTGVTEGTYQSTVNVGSTVAAQTSATIAGFALKGQGTSLNDVLKGIVSLIASINKQIAALAKLVTKK